MGYGSMTRLGPFNVPGYHLGDCRQLLAQLPDESVHCVVTSPPYWAMRDYGLEPTVWGGDSLCTHAWGEPMSLHKGGPQGPGVLRDGGRGVVAAQAAVKDIACGSLCECGAWCGHLGLEPTPEMFVEHLAEVFHQVWRVLRADGTLWLNLGDSYAAGGQGAGLKHKDLVGVPWRVAFALQAEGWWLRSDVIWSKPNPMPEAVTDRPTKAHEYLFLLSKSERYHYDQDAIKEPVSGGSHSRGDGLNPKATGKNEASGDRRWTGFNERWRVKQNASFAGAVSGPVDSRNRRTVWTIATEPTADAHFATFPRKLVEPCILAGCPAGGIVLDPFGGSGTVGRVAEDLGRRWILFDLNPAYGKIAKRKTAQMGILAHVVGTE